MIRREERIGNQRLILGDCLEVMPLLPRVDAVLTDPPFSERTHKGHDAGACVGRDGAARERLGYSALTLQDVDKIAQAICGVCDGWVCWITDHTLAPHVASALDANGRYVFAPLPFYHPGRSVRLSGDGPCSWTDWIVPARTANQIRWGTLPGGYVAGEGWTEKHRMGGKPLPLMMQLVQHYSSDGDTVLDPFLGGGTTLVACAKLGRQGIGIEVDPVAFERACKRVEEAARQPDLFIQPKPPAPVQEGFDL